MTFNKMLQIAFEIAQEQVIILGREQEQDIVVIFLQMPQQVQEDGIRRIAVENMAVVLAGVLLGIEKMAEQLFTQRFQQCVLGFEMGIEGRSAHVGGGNDLADCNPAEILFGEQLCKGMENGLSGFFLTSVHCIHHTNSVICSVANHTATTYVAVRTRFAIIILNSVFDYVLIVP